MPQLGRRTLGVPGAIGPPHFSPLGKLHRTSAEQLLKAAEKNKKSLGGFLTWEYCSKYPQIIHFKRILHYHPVWGTPIYRNLHLAMRTLPLKMNMEDITWHCPFLSVNIVKHDSHSGQAKKALAVLVFSFLRFTKIGSSSLSLQKMSSKRSLRSKWRKNCWTKSRNHHPTTTWDHPTSSPDWRLRRDV